MAIDKSIGQAPQGLEELANAQPAMSIEIENPDSVTLDDGSMEITIEPGKETNDEFNANLAEELDEGQLTELSGDLIGEYDADINSRKDWLTTYVDGLELLGLKVEDRTEPWEGACNVYHPLMSEALVKFQAETMMETFPAAGPVKTVIVGKLTKEKEESAERVRDDMNYQLTEEMPEYRPEHERMLWGLGLSGNAFKKVYFDPNLERQVAMYVPAEDIVVPYGASSLETAERVTHVMRKTPNEIRKLQVAGFYRDVDLGEPFLDIDEAEKKIAEKLGFNPTEDDRYKILEMHVNLDLENGDSEDGIALPYVVTIEKGTGTILAIRRNWDPEDRKKLKRQHFVHYGYIPGFGFYCFGLIHLIGAFAKSGTMILRQLVDAGTLSNLPGGLKSRGLRIKGDDTPIAPGEFRDVDVPSGAIRDNILMLPYKEPSQTLSMLMDKIIDEGRAFANADGLQVSDMSSNSPVGTTLAILERTLKVMSAVQARIYYAMKQEFKLLKGIIRDYTPKEYSYDPEVGDRRAKQSDYDNVDVIPVSDPNAATMSQKVVQYQAVMQMAQSNPQIYDQVELNKQMLEVLGVKNVAKLIPTAEDQKPKDPVSENMAIFNGKPVKAFIYQDHEAHIQVHQAAMQDPKIQALIGQNPQAQAIQAAAYAHINEHVAFAYRKHIEEQLGVPLPEPDKVLPEDVEAELAPLIAKASEQLLQKNQAEAQQQQAQAQQQDPVVQMQQQELQIKQQDLQARSQKMMADHELEQQKLQLEQQLEAQKVQIEQDREAARLELERQKLEIEKMRIESQERIAGANLGARIELDKQKMEQAQAKDGMRMGLDAQLRKQEQEHKSTELHINALDKTAQHAQKAEDRKHRKELAAFNKEQIQPKE
jgi:hypothetical protein